MPLTQKQHRELVRLFSDDIKIFDDECEFMEYLEFLNIDLDTSKRLFSEFNNIHPFHAQNMSVEDWSDLVEYVTTNQTALCY